MTRRMRSRSTPAENMRMVLTAIPWKLLLLLVVIGILVVPTFKYGLQIGSHVMPSLSGWLYKLSDVPATATPTPPPAFSNVLPQAGQILYTVQDGDSCDSILTEQMRMVDAGEIFADTNPQTVAALNQTLHQDCHAIQPGMTLSLSPHYPLAALSGIVKKIEATSPQQVLPTPLIRVTRDTETTVDCSGGCLLTVQVATNVQIRLEVETTLSLHVGSWVWTQAALALKPIPGFDRYPYVDPKASLNGMRMRSCDFQVENLHDDNSPGCDELKPNTISNDRGAWLLGVVDPTGLDHWKYPLHLSKGTRVLLWLSLAHGKLTFQAGNPLYRYDETSHLYKKV